MATVSSEPDGTLPFQMEGVSLNTGAAFGIAVIHSSIDLNETLDQPPVSKDLQATELNKLNHAFDGLILEIQTVISEASFSNKTNKDSLDILNIHLMLAKDPSWQRQLNEAIITGVTASKAVDETLASIRNKLKAKGGQTLWHERIQDFEDLSSRLKRHLSPSSSLPEPHNDTPIIIVSDRIGPADLLDYKRENLAGLVLIEQSQTSHVAIVARSLKIPVVGLTKSHLQKISQGAPLLVDGYEGCVYVHPDQDFVKNYEGLAAQNFKESLSQKSAPLPAQTVDGVRISLLLNAGLVEDVDHIEAAGTEGIGLYRTEISFMMRPKFLNIIEQTKMYREILQRAKNYPVVFRTLDVGGDKVLPYLERLQSENPKKQERVTKVFFDRSLLLQYQLRALIRACPQGDLTIMLPMVAEVEEVITARAILNAEIDREKSKGKPVPKGIKLGAMIEVPSLVYQLPQLFPHVDFLSVGTNDLFQFFFGLDRNYPKLTDRYDVLSLTFLKLLKTILTQCEQANVPVSICGEMAGRPLDALALIGLGYRTLSMSAAAAPLVKRMICGLSYKHIGKFMADVFSSANIKKGTVRQDLEGFAKNQSIAFD
jgi:phosphotransferase system enzyme I (PtsP)